MWTLVIFAVVSAVVASPVSMSQEREEISQESSTHLQLMDESVIKIILYTQTETGGVEVFLSNSTSISSTSFDSTKETVFVTHGWRNSYESLACTVVKNAFLESADLNVFLVDWSGIASLGYVDAQRQVITIGTLLGNLVKSLVSTGEMDLEKTSMVGHSLGAHLIGVAGKVLVGQLKTIVGLDPAGPRYSVDTTNNRLDKGDAEFVQIIHTCAGLLGFPVAIGDADYWPNGGSFQPGCESDSSGACNHGRSFQLFSESLISGNFYSYKCNSYADYETRKCTGQSSYLGELNIDRNASGSYYLDTNSEEPYARGK